eukprot:TRINITY_DN973_c1_g1_i1.p1 TRINITY_DN973_c1_g1~~TRINITY_DN973_c1_g1_i1.p1  ORF type:complete len:293 (-),score=42.61 TRINITY_DN973_c1_g1_i1:109-987(-)
MHRCVCRIDSFDHQLQQSLLQVEALRIFGQVERQWISKSWDKTREAAAGQCLNCERYHGASSTSFCSACWRSIQGQGLSTTQLWPQSLRLALQSASEAAAAEQAASLEALNQAIRSAYMPGTIFTLLCRSLKRSGRMDFGRYLQDHCFPLFSAAQVAELRRVYPRIWNAANDHEVGARVVDWWNITNETHGEAIYCSYRHDPPDVRDLKEQDALLKILEVFHQRFHKEGWDSHTKAFVSDMMTELKLEIAGPQNSICMLCTATQAGMQHFAGSARNVFGGRPRGREQSCTVA